MIDDPRDLFTVDQPSLEYYPIKGFNTLMWRDDLGFGYLKSNGFEYGQAYWEKYQDYSSGGIGVALTNARRAFVENVMSDFENICDVGIGSGQFVSMTGCYGIDVNPLANEWLTSISRYADPLERRFAALTMWDVLEHIDDPRDLLTATDKIFTSLPIHLDVEACLTSKHLRPNEHIWHFTEAGVKNFMSLFGFECHMISTIETQLGREDIMSFYFYRPS
jgi:hypothetical protein